MTKGERFNKYQNTEKALNITCELLIGAVIYGIDKAELCRRMIETEECVSSDNIKKFIMNNLDRFSNDEIARHNAIKRLGW